MKQQLAYSIFAWTLIAVVSVGMGIMWIFTPESADDLWYRFEFDGYLRKGFDTLGTFIAQFSYRIQRDNIRLANILFILQMPLRCEWLVGVFLAACWTAMWVYVRKLFDVMCARPISIAASICLAMCLLPWEEYMFSHDFAINYVFPSAFTVISFYYFIQLAQRKNIRHIYAFYALVLITGFSHEGFAIPLIAAFGMYTLLFARRDKRAWIATFCLLPGILLFALTAFRVRYCSIGGLSIYGEDNLSLGFKMASIIAAGILLYTIWLYSRRRLVMSERFIALFLGAVVILASVAIRWSVHGTQRAGWCALMFEAIVIPILLFRESYYKSKIANIAQIAVSAVILMALSVHFTATTIDTFRLRSWYYPALEKFKTSSDGYVFCEMKGLKDYSRLSLGHPFRRFSIPSYEMEWLSIYYKEKGGVQCIFFPAEFEDVDANPGRKVAGDNPFYEKGGFLYCPESLWPSGESSDWNVDGVRNVRYDFTPFVLSDGSRYYYATCTSVSFSKMKADVINPAR